MRHFSAVRQISRLRVGNSIDPTGTRGNFDSAEFQESKRRGRQ